MILEQYEVSTLTAAVKIRNWIKERGMNARVLRYIKPNAYWIIAYEPRNNSLLHKDKKPNVND